MKIQTKQLSVLCNFFLESLTHYALYNISGIRMDKNMEDNIFIVD